MIIVLPTHVQPVQGGDMVMVGATSLQTYKWWLHMQQLLLEEEAVAPCIQSWIPSLLPRQALWKTGLCSSHIHSGHNFCNIAFVYPPDILKPTEQEVMENRNNVLLVLDTENCNNDKPTITAITHWDESLQNSGNLLAGSYLKPVICAMQKINGIFWSFVLLCYVNPACIFITNSIWYLWHAEPFSPCMLLYDYHPNGLASVAMWYAVHYKFIREWMVVS